MAEKRLRLLNEFPLGVLESLAPLQDEFRRGAFSRIEHAEQRVLKQVTAFFVPRKTKTAELDALR